MIFKNRLYPIADYSIIQSLDGMISAIKSISNLPIGALQIRMKDNTDDEVVYVGENVKPILDKHNIPLIINDRVHIAKYINASGVHIGQDDMSVQRARRILGKNKIVGLSIANLNQAHLCNKLDVDYFGIGPVFNTYTKVDAAPPVGVEGFKLIGDILDKPIVAIGGINHSNISIFNSIKVEAIAVISAIFDSCDIERSCNKLINKISYE